MAKKGHGSTMAKLVQILNSEALNRMPRTMLGVALTSIVYEKYLNDLARDADTVRDSVIWIKPEHTQSKRWEKIAIRPQRPADGLMLKVLTPEQVGYVRTLITFEAPPPEQAPVPPTLEQIGLDESALLQGMPQEFREQCRALVRSTSVMFEELDKLQPGSPCLTQWIMAYGMRLIAKIGLPQTIILMSGIIKKGLVPHEKAPE